MKKQILVFCCIILAILGCKKINKSIEFNMEFNESVIIPSSTGINLPINILSPDVESNSLSTFASHDTNKDLVEEIKLKTFNITITSPSNSDFSFLKSIAIYISADGLSETKIAWKDNVPVTAGTVLNLDVTSTDLKEYIKKDSYTLRLSTVTDELLTSDQHIDMHSELSVKAKIFKL